VYRQSYHVGKCGFAEYSAVLSSDVSYVERYMLTGEDQYSGRHIFENSNSHSSSSSGKSKHHADHTSANAEINNNVIIGDIGGAPGEANSLIHDDR
jgi:hypothetical protein